MAHYAFLDENNIVTEVIVGKDENDNPSIDWEQYYSEVRSQVCKRTSYNTRLGKHLNGGTPFRKNYASIGYRYSIERDAFILPKPFDSWTLDEETCGWNPPIEYPSDGNVYQWNEQLGEWELIINKP